MVKQKRFAKLAAWVAVVSSFGGCAVQEHSPSGAAGDVAERAVALAPPESVSVLPQRDVSLQALAPNGAFGAAALLDVNRSAIRFSPESLAGAVGATDYVVSATLTFTIAQNKLRAGQAAREVSLFRLDRAWTEMGATFNCAIDSNTSNGRADCSGASAWSMGAQPTSWITPGATATIAAGQRTVSFDVSADVRSFLGGAPNEGWVIVGGPLGTLADYAILASRESTTPPRLALSVQRCSSSLCDDGDVCTVDRCDAVGQCAYDSASAATSCDDGDACTGGDHCGDGVCTPGTEDLCTPPVVVLNEAESSGGSPGDWAELYNAGTVPADVSGWIFKDNDDTHSYAIPAGTIIPVGGYLVLDESAFGFGLGQNESVRIFLPDGTTLIDSQSWGPHASTTYGRCPNGTGAFTTTSSSTKGAANDCAAPPADGGVDGGSDAGTDAGMDAGMDAGAANVVVNESESSGGTPGDWAEIYNSGPNAVDMTGWTFRDNDDTHIYAFPAGTVIAAGGYFVIEEEALGFGLGANEQNRLFDPSGALVDIQSWTAHATTTYGRCPNGTGMYTTTTSSTKGAANDCSAPSDGGTDAGTDAGTDGGIAFGTWPGGNNVTTVDMLAEFGGNLSGLTYEPAEGGDPSILWAVQNNPAVLYRMVFDGSLWVQSATDGWDIGKTVVYPNGTGVPDCESLTKAELDSPAMYIATERNNSVSGTSRLSILRVDTSAPGTTLVATHEWNLNADLPAVGANLGLEAITWIPDSYLTANHFVDESTGNAYEPGAYADHGSGVFFVGIEANGTIYAYVLDHVSGTAHRVATILSGFPGVMGMEFDRDVGTLWSYCDDTCGNRATVLAIEDDVTSSGFGHFVIRAGFERPTTLPSNMNNEGIAIAPESECDAGLKSFFFSDDSETSGHSIRLDSIPCGPLF